MGLKLDSEEKEKLLEALARTIDLLVPLAKKPYAREGLFQTSQHSYGAAKFQKDFDEAMKDISKAEFFTNACKVLGKSKWEGKRLKCIRGVSTYTSEHFLYKCIFRLFNSSVNLSDQKFLEDFFEKILACFRDTTEVVVTCNLIGIEFPSLPTNLTDQLQILPMTKLDIAKGEMRSFPISHHYIFSPKHISKIQYKYEIPVTVDTNEDPCSSTFQIKDFNVFQKQLENIISAIRILKRSNAFIDPKIEYEVDHFLFDGIHGRLNDTWQAIRTDNTTFTEDETSRFKKLFLSLENGNTSPIPIDRLRFSVERKSPLDRVIDLIVGLEAFFKSSGSPLIMLRAANYLENNTEKKKEIYNLIDGYRNTRHAIIHGSRVSDPEHQTRLQKENIDKLEEILRRCLQLILLEQRRLPNSSAEWVSNYFS